MTEETIHEPGPAPDNIPPQGFDPSVAAARARRSRTLWQSRLPWDDAELMAERRREAQMLGALKSDEMTEHISQRIQALEATRPLCDQVRHDYLQGRILLDIFDKAYWLRDPEYERLSFRLYVLSIATKVFGKKVSWATIERRLLLAQSYSLEEAENYGHQGACTTVLSFIATLDQRLRPLLLNLTIQSELSSDMVMDIGRRAQRKLDKDPMSQAEATVRNAVLAHQEQKESDRRQNGNRGNGQGGGDPEKEAKLRQREAAVAERERAADARDRALEDRERRVSLREEMAGAGGEVNEIVERRLGEAMAREAEVARAQAALVAERATVAAQKEENDRQAAQLGAQTAQAQKRQQELEALTGQLSSREAEVQSKEQALLPAWRDLEEKQATYQPREQDLTQRIEQVAAKEQELTRKEAQLKPLETEYREGLLMVKQEEERLRVVAAELREARRQMDNGIIVVVDNPVDLESTVDCIGQEAERISDLAEVAENQVDDEAGTPGMRECKAMVEAFLKVENARAQMQPVIKEMVARLGEKDAAAANKVLSWGDTERKVYTRKREQARREREQAAREAEGEEDDEE